MAREGSNSHVKRTDMHLKASFIVPTYNRAEILSVSLPLLLAQDMPADAFEVIVVSDGVDPKVDQIIKTQGNKPNLHYAALPKQQGPGAARNKAISLAKGDVLVFVDDDSLVDSGFLARHLAHHLARGQDGRDVVVTGPIIDVSDVPDFANPSKPGLFSRHTNPFPTGNASVLRARVVKVGGFDENFRFYGWEDPELFARLNQPKLLPIFEKDAPIYHYHPHQYAMDLAARLRRETHRGRNGAVFYHKHPTLSVALQTKQHWFYRGLDRLLNRLLQLDKKQSAVMQDGWQPSSKLIAELLIHHAEITAGRAKLAELRA